MADALTGRTAVVILAAGASRRLGRPKQLEPWEGVPLLRRAALTALEAGVGPVFVILGCRAEECRAVVGDLEVQVVMNEGWEEGMAASIRAGVAAAERAVPPCHAVLVMTCDQPKVPAAHLAALAEATVAGAPAAGSAYGGRVGVPAVFGREVWPQLMTLRGDRGARSVLSGIAPARLVAIPFAAAAADVDGPATSLDGFPRL